MKRVRSGSQRFPDPVGKRQWMTASSSELVSRDSNHIRGRCGVECRSGPRGGSGEHSESIGDRLPTWHPAAIYGVGLLSCYLALAAATTVVGLAFTRWIFRWTARVLRRAACSGWPTTGRPSSIPFVGRLGDLRRVGHSGAGSGDRDHLGAAKAVVARGIRARRDPARVGDVPHDGVLRRARPSTRRTTRRTPGRRQLPLGHVAASIAVYSGFALLLTSRMTSTRAKALVWAAALAIPPIVAVSRMYRGMHHPLDTARRRSHGDRRAGSAPRAYHESGRPQAGGTRA